MQHFRKRSRIKSGMTGNSKALTPLFTLHISHSQFFYAGFAGEALFADYTGIVGELSGAFHSHIAPLCFLGLLFVCISFFISYL